MAEPRNRYSAVSLTLHWLLAALILVQVILINVREGTEQPLSGQLIGWHKSIGLTILVLTLVRIGWRLANPALPAPAGTPAWEKIAARVTHALFYVALIAIPVTGWLASSAGGREIEWFGLFQWPLLPVGGGREAAKGYMNLHELAMYGLYGLIALHVLAALKHQFINRDNVLHRMIPLIPRRP